MSYLSFLHWFPWPFSVCAFVCDSISWLLSLDEVSPWLLPLPSSFILPFFQITSLSIFFYHVLLKCRAKSSKKTASMDRTFKFVSPLAYQRSRWPAYSSLHLLLFNPSVFCHFLLSSLFISFLKNIILWWGGGGEPFKNKTAEKVSIHKAGVFNLICISSIWCTVYKVLQSTKRK